MRPLVVYFGRPSCVNSWLSCYSSVSRLTKKSQNRFAIEAYMNRHQTQTGFTMIELLVTIVIGAVLLSLAGPSFVELVKTNRIQANTDLFFTSLITARSEALKRNQPVVTCKSGNGSGCSVDSGIGWEQGWLIYADENADNTLDSGEPIITVREALPAGYTLRPNGSNFNNRLTYRQDGTVSGNGTFALCDSDGDLDRAREVIIQNAGRPRVSKTAVDCNTP